MDISSWWEQLSIWFGNHGWTILLTLLLAYFVHRFGRMAIARFIHHSIDSSSRFETKRDRDLRAKTLIDLFASILRVAIWVVTALVICAELDVLNFIGPFIAGAGVVSLLLSFGIQTFVRDFISGIFIVAENQYRVGDVIAATTTGDGTVMGTVIRISMRTTTLRDNDGAIHFIPNGNITRAANQTLDYAKVNIELNIPLGASFAQAEREINTLGTKMGHEEEWKHKMVQAPYYHGVQSIEKEGVVIEVRAKTVPTEQWHVSSELRKRLAQLLESENYFVQSSKAKRSEQSSAKK